MNKALYVVYVIIVILVVVIAGRETDDDDRNWSRGGGHAGWGSAAGHK